MRTFRLAFLLCQILTLLAVSFIVIVPLALGQTTPDLEEGMKPYGFFHGGEIDQVSLSSGKLVLSIPLASYPQRGGKLTLAFELQWRNLSPLLQQACFNSCTITGYRNYSGAGSLEFVSNYDYHAGLSYAPPGTGITGTYGWATSPDGAEHLMGYLNPTYETIDATGMRFDPASLTLSDAQGIRYTMGPLNSLSTGDVTKVEDANGNFLTNTINSTGTITSWTDTLGRSIPTPLSAITTTDYTHCTGPNPITTASTWTVPGLNGGTQTLKFCYANFPYNFTLTVPGGGPTKNVTGSVQLLQSIVLPNLTTWTFQYDSAYASLSEVTLPTGGTIAYTWQLFSAPCQFTQPSKTITQWGFYLAVASRTVNANDGTGPHTWNYSGWTTTGGTIKVTDPLANDSLYVITGLGGTGSLYETQTQTFQGSSSSGTLLKTVTTDYSWINNPFYPKPQHSCTNVFSVVPIRITTSWPDGQTSKEEMDYDPGFSFYAYSSSTSYSGSATYGGVTAKRDYDYANGAPGALLRQTKTSYIWQSNSTYLADNFLAYPSSVQVLDGSSVQRAFSVYNYDQYSLASSGVGTQHDSSPPNGSYRANRTSTARWLNGSTVSTTNCPISVSNGYVYTYSIFFDTGMVQKSTDSCGNSAGDPNHTTTYAYSSNYAGAWPTTITNPLGQSASKTYDFNTGAVTSFTDPNNQTTTYQYNDSLGRLTEVDYPDRGITKNLYTDTALAVNVETQREIDSTRWTDSFVLYDGFVRPVVQSVANDEATPWDRKDTCYDALGRASFASYSYQSGSATSAPNCSGTGDTFTLYDALGRLQQLTHSDGATVLTAYAGRATQVQDEGNGTRRGTRISQVDGLGRLASVCEVTSAGQLGSSGSPAACGQDIGGTGFLTTYGHDTLDNLTSASQNGLNGRSFQYDSLSRLTSATNPESGTTTYGYDANGNVTRKTDARNVTTTYAYDRLNRLTGKTFSDGTPAATFNYDQTSALGVTLTNTIGRKSSESTAGSLPTGSVFSYDRMGRIADNSQCTPQNCGTGVFALQYPQYDFLGDLVSGTNAAGVTFTYSYNRAPRLTSMTTNFVDPSHPGTLFSSAHYNAAGALLSASLGNGIAETRTYDTRLRLTSIADGSNYSLTIPSSGGYAPNSDILAANDSVNGNWRYSYDDFNRLSGSNQNSGQSVYSYVYDRFGNRWQQNGQHSMQLSFSGANNRMDGYSYDAAGNLLNDGSHNYFYDAENRLIQVDGTLGSCSTATACYVYDAEGRRVRKATASGTLDFLYDAQGHKVAEVDTTGTFQRGELYAGGRHLAVYAPDPGPTGATFFIHADWLGTERARTNVSGTACETITSLPFGDAQIISDSCGDSAGDVSPMHFTGKERDPESGLDNFGARYSSSSMGRFMTPDPLLNSGRPWEPQSWNRYAYARNNPLNIVDSTGLYDLANNCSDDKKCRHHADDLKKGLDNLQKKVDKMKDGPEKQRLQAALTALGTEGDHNGVAVAFGALKDQNAAAETTFQSSDTGQLSATVTFNPDKISSREEYAIDAAHEGTHVEDFLTQAVNDYIAHGSLPALSDFSQEYRGYQTSIFAASALGWNSFSRSYDGANYVLWNGSWAQVDKNITNYVTKFHDQIGKLNHPETTPHNPWPN